jgi:pyruvate,water dikinase
MFNIGMPVPDAFIVTAQTYKSFVESTKLQDRILNLLKPLDVNNTASLQDVAKKIQDIIVETEMPEDIKEEVIESYGLLSHHSEDAKAHDLVDADIEPFVAVRSSATAEDLPEASFAGQQATFLNVKGDEALLKAVRDCWASLFTARAIYYREKNNFSHDQVFIAVVVQRMVDSSVSGVMFSINPATNSGDEIVVEAVIGLGETIVSGSVNPDLFIVDKNSLEIKKTEIKEQDFALIRDKDNNTSIKKDLTKEEGGKQKITNEQVIELAKLSKKLEEHYNLPQDTEWAVEKDKVYIVQTRAVTTFKKKEDAKEGNEKKEDVSEDSEDDGGEHKVLVRGETASQGVAFGPVSIIKDASELEIIKEGDVLVTGMTNPDMVPAMKKAKAIVTDEGGLTCHAAIVSREMGTPCIVGTKNATTTLKNGSTVTVNATKGEVYEGAMKIEQPKAEAQQVVSSQEIITATNVKVIMDIPDYVDRAAKTNADGVGLLRLEIMIAESGIHPAEYMRTGKKEEYIKMLMKGIGTIASAFKDKPVWIRTSDIRTDEYRNLKGGDKEPKETDPMIGWHAIRRALDEPDILKSEFEAVKRLHDQGLTNVGVMLPFVIRTREVRKAKEIMRSVGLEPQQDVDFGVMIETPASCWIIEDLCKEGIDFVSFGTNDLTQLTLGVDRNNQHIAKLFDEMHVGVLSEIERVVKTCKRHGVKTSICGQAGSRPEMAAFLVKIGIDSISANPDAVHHIREVVARTEKKLMLDAERDKLDNKTDSRELSEEQ